MALLSHYRRGDLVWYRPHPPNKLPDDCPYFIEAAGELVSVNSETNTALFEYLDHFRCPKRIDVDLKDIRVRKPRERP